MISDHEDIVSGESDSGRRQQVAPEGDTVFVNGFCFLSHGNFPG